MQLPTSRAVLVALIGQGIGPSLSPPMHEREGQRHGMRYIYRRIEFHAETSSAEELGRLLTYSQRLGFDGLNITYPAKQTVLPLLDELASSAQMIGAVNTVVFAEGRTIGHNTDVTGFKASLDDSLEDTPCGEVVLVGAGGAGSAVAHALVMRGVEKLCIVDVDEAKVSALLNSLRDSHGFSASSAGPDDLPARTACADGIVNATPFGMAHHPGTPFDPALLRSTHWVADVVYRPADTVLLREARKRSALAISGLGMAMHQAADAFEIFTGETADRTSMLADLNDLIAAENAPTGAALH